MSDRNIPTDLDLGHAEGEPCNRNGCKGVIREHPVENCSCHICPPCSACTEDRGYCETCGWVGKDDEPFNDHLLNVDKKTGVARLWTLRPLDKSKLDWHSKPHTNSSMIKEGVYPLAMTRDEVEAKVRGTFGGRFDYFGEGRFKYVAYTD